MIQYLVILLDDTSVSYCHYENTKTDRRLISLDDLKAGIFFAMKQNLTIQFVYPNYELPDDYRAIIESIDHHKVMPASHATADAQVIVSDLNETITGWTKDVALVVRANKNELFQNVEKLVAWTEKCDRINVVLTDADTFAEADFEAYRKVLSQLADAITGQYARGHFPQLNILTDRVMLDRMNNCNAGVENMTLAPNGKFYICPAFYYEDPTDAIGTPADEPQIGNRQLYHIDYAPLCRCCDAYQCRRCVWLNRKTTLEVNTPSHEQCVIAHLERNAGREWLKGVADRFPDKEITEIHYLDPFDNVNVK